jgi:hypothetical protein
VIKIDQRISFWLAGIVFVLFANPKTTQAAIFLDLSEQCISAMELTTALNVVLEKNQAQDTLDVGVRELLLESGKYVIKFRIIGRHDGVVQLERSLELEGHDCPHSIPLIQAVLSGFFQEIPREKWAPKPSEPRIVVKKVVETITKTERDSYLSLSLALEPGLRLLPTGGGLACDLTLDVGTKRHQLSATFGPRIATPQEIGQGQFFEMFLLAGLGWQYRAERFNLRAQIFTGTVLVHAYGVPGARDEWLFWLEGRLYFLWKLEGLRLGPFLAASPVGQSVSGHQQTVRLAPVQAGIAVEFLLWSK